MPRGGSIINIAGTTPVDDPEYRYKMPAVFGKIEGSGNGIKTAIPNISDVATSLHRQPAEVNKFFGTELGAQTRYNPDTDRAIVNGAHTDMVLQDLMHRYIEKFVLCPNCRLPETDYKIKNGAIFHRCKACGSKEMVDMSHKLCTFILKEAKTAKKDKKNNDDNNNNKKKSKKDKKDKDSDGSEKDDKKKSKKDKKDKKKDKKDKKEKGNENGSSKDYIKDALVGKTEENGDDFGDDDAASLASEEQEEDHVDDETAMGHAVHATKDYLKENPNASAADLAEYVTNQQMASALKSYDKVHIFVRAAFTHQFFKKKEIEKYAPAISAITNGNRIMERHLIAALEAFCVDKPKNFAVMLKQLYDEDALDEETILEWADQGRSEFTLDGVSEETRAIIRGEAEPVVVWLQEAESEDESSDDGEE